MGTLCTTFEAHVARTPTSKRALFPWHWPITKHHSTLALTRRSVKRRCIKFPITKLKRDVSGDQRDWPLSLIPFSPDNTSLVSSTFSCRTTTSEKNSSKCHGDSYSNENRKHFLALVINATCFSTSDVRESVGTIHEHLMKLQAVPLAGRGRR